MKKSKKFLLGMLVIVLTFGILAAGCKSSGEPKEKGTSKSESGNGPVMTGEKTILEWVKADGVYAIGDGAALQFMGETWVQSVKGSPIAAGSMTGMPGIPPAIDVDAFKNKIEEIINFPKDIINALESAGQGIMDDALATAQIFLTALENGDIVLAVTICDQLITGLLAAPDTVPASIKENVKGWVETGKNLGVDLVNMGKEFVEQWIDFLNNAKDGEINLTVNMMFIAGKWQTMEQVDKLLGNPIASKTIPQEVKDSVDKFKKGLTFTYSFTKEPPFLLLSAK